jgi:hypothetical protein
MPGFNRMVVTVKICEQDGMVSLLFREALGLPGSLSPLESTQPRVQWVLTACFPGVNRPENELSVQLHFSAGINAWRCISMSPYVFAAHCLIKQSESLHRGSHYYNEAL